MRIGIVLAVLSGWCLQLHAAPLIFTSEEFSTDAVAVVGLVADVDSDTSPPSPLPLISSATALDTEDLALAGALAIDGLLSTSAEANSVAGAASAVGIAHFLGAFTAPSGVLDIFLDFSTTSFASASGNLTLIVTSGTTVIDEVFTSSGAVSRTFTLTPGAPSTLEVLLISEVTLLTGGDGLNQSVVTLDTDVRPAEVPEPGSLALIALGLASLGALRRRARSRMGRFDDSAAA